MKTQVCISIDLEFSIAGAFTEPQRYSPIGSPSIEGLVKTDHGQQSQGIGFLERCFKDTGIKASFFVEAMQATYFGNDEMAQHCQRLADQGHDLQLHIHPCWLRFNDPEWRSHNGGAPSDTLTDRSIEEIRNIIETGKQTFSEWQLPAPIALRTGGLSISRDVYKAMRGSGIDMASNIGTAINPPIDQDLQIRSGRKIIEGITEIPVTSYQDIRLAGREHIKGLTITGSSWGEMHSLLRQAQQKGTETLMVLTHAHEFFKYTAPQFTNIRPNRTNQQRLTKLCEFLAKHDDEFESVTFASAKKNWKNKPEAASDLSVTPLQMLTRLAENTLNDRISSW